MANNRELSQLASLIVVDDTTRNIGIATTGFSKVGIGTTNPERFLDINKDINGATDVRIRNNNTGTSAFTSFSLVNDGSSIGLQNNSLSRTVSRFGSVSGGWGEILLSSGNGIKLGTLNATPLVLGTNDTEALRIDSSQRVGIGTTNPLGTLQVGAAGTNVFVVTSTGSVGIGTRLPESKLIVREDNQNSTTYSSQVYRTSTNFSSGVGHRAYYESYYTTAGVQTSYASGINAQVSASVAAGSTNNGYIRGGLDAVWRNNANAQSSTDNGTLAYLYGRGISYGHFNDNAVSPITNTATGLSLTPYCLTGSIGTLIGLDINSVATAVGATATNVYGINCEIDTTDGTNPYNLYIGGNAKNYIAGNVGIGTTNPTSKLHVIGDVLVTGITTSTDFNSSSDINLKDNIERIQNPIDKLQQLDGVTFNWKETHRASVGVIAQQVEKVLPQLVSGDETKTVNYNGLIALLIECVKEQQIEINNLKEKLK